MVKIESFINENQNQGIMKNKSYIIKVETIFELLEEYKQIRTITSFVKEKGEDTILLDGIDLNLDEIPKGQLGEIIYCVDNEKENMIFEVYEFKPFGSHHINNRLLNLLGNGIGNKVEKISVNNLIKQEVPISDARKSQLNKIGVDERKSYTLGEYIQFFTNITS